VYYIMNWSSLNATGPIGTDAMSAFVYVKWFNSYFPDIPFWYPLQGAGVSFVAGYPHLAHFLVAFLHNITDIPLINAFNWLEFSVFLVSAIGIFIYCWARLEYPKQPWMRQCIGLVASIFYLTAPITYVHTIPWGFYAETVSYLFTAPTLIALDYFIDNKFKGKRSFLIRLSFAYGMLLYTFTFLTHFSTGMGLTHLILGLIALRTILNIKSNPRVAIKNSLKITIYIFLTLAGLFAWRYASYADYNVEVAKGGFSGYSNPNISLKQITENKAGLLDFSQVLGLKLYGENDPRQPLDDWSYQTYIWFFALIALLLGWIRSKKILLFGIMSLYGFTTYSLPLGVLILNKIGPFAEIFNGRSVWTVYRLIVPIVAAYGIFIVIELAISLFNKLFIQVKSIHFTVEHLIKPVIIIPFMLGVALLCITQFSALYNRNASNMRLGIDRINQDNIWKRIEKDKENQTQSFFNIKVSPKDPYDAKQLYFSCAQNNVAKYDFINQICEKSFNKISEQINLLDEQDVNKMYQYCETTSQKDSTQFSFCNTIQKYSKEYQLNPKNWPDISLTNKDPSEEISKEVFKHVPDNPLQTRYDLSGLTGSVIMHAPLISNVSQTQVYINSLTLFSALWNYQSSVMYSDQPLYQKPGILTELAKWFGYEYILAITNSDNARGLYEEDPNWEKLNPQDDWWQFKSPTTLTTWTKRPALLFIGNETTFQYDQAFKIFNLGVLSYDDAIIFAGKEHVDDYKITDLQKFDALFLKAYNYRNQNKGHELLTEYVKSGGSLFIDTGWQYKSPDWQLENAPAFFPTNSLVWKQINKKSDIIADNTEKIGLTTQDNNLGELVPIGGNWGISAQTDIRNDSTVLAQSDNTPLVIAREYQKGRVIWSGMNIVPHIEGYKNENIREMELLKYSLRWLLKSDDKPAQDLKISVKRQSPDKISFKFDDQTNQTSTLYFREAYFPKWHASLSKSTDKSIEVFRAGPRLIGLRVPPVKKGDQLNLEIRKLPKEIILELLALTTTIYLVIYLIGITKPLENKIKYLIRKLRRGISDTNSDIANFKMHDDPNNRED
jgi:hypothetical protein